MISQQVVSVQEVVTPPTTPEVNHCLGWKRVKGNNHRDRQDQNRLKQRWNRPKQHQQNKEQAIQVYRDKEQQQQQQ